MSSLTEKVREMEKEQNTDTTTLLVDDCHGIYVPQVWAMRYRMFPEAWNVTREQLDVLLRGPDDDVYWETWDEVLNTAEFTDSQGRVWHLWQDGALWAYCDDGEQFV
jgi:hypothetical protein